MKVEKQLKEPISRILHPKSSSGHMGFVDKRPQAASQIKLIDSISQSKIIQPKAYADPNNPQITRQWDGPFFWRTERLPNLALTVDLLKKEMLTYIAHCINLLHNYNPHVAVVIVGDSWYVSTNSNVNQINLQQDSNTVKTHIETCWNALNNSCRLGFWGLRTRRLNQVDEKAVFIAFRWATNKSNVIAIANPPFQQNRRIHGEMQIIRNLQQLGTLRDQQWNGWHRIVRVGGTKTPCLDCAWEMSKVPYSQNDINIGAQGAHVGRNASRVSNRVVTTMSNDFGAGFPTWQEPFLVNPQRNQQGIPGQNGMPVDQHYNQQQNQNYNQLRNIYNALNLGIVLQ